MKEHYTIQKKKKTQRSKEHQKMVIKGNCIDKYNTNLIGGGDFFPSYFER